MSKLVLAPGNSIPLDQFPVPDPINEPINRHISWGLEPADFNAPFGQVEKDVSFEYRLASLSSKYRYTFSNGNRAVEALIISDVVVALRLHTYGLAPMQFSLLSLVVNLNHWSSNRSQQMFPWISLALYNSAGQRLTVVSLPHAFVSDCQLERSWISNPVPIAGPASEYFRSASATEILLPQAYGGKPYDHGPICF